MPGVDAVSVLEELRRVGKPATAVIYRRHGAHDETWGVTYADLKRVAKSLRGRSALAEPLWASGIHDARVLATMIVSPEALSRATFDDWISGARCRATANAVADVVSHRADAHGIARQWIGTQDEWAGVAGWSAMASLAMGNRLDDATASELATRIRDTIHGSPNATRYAMNMALIAIGIACPGVRPAVLAAATAIGKVVVDHGRTGCVTPDIVPYIERALARKGRIAPSGTQPSAI
ncbi:MAG: hypothetical protein EB145_18145 [Proteobacteria bacterium]|nr:hypothetical protein [Pseudomonadota bacterium]